MKELTPNFDFNAEVLEDRFSKLRESLHIDVDSAKLRNKVSAQFTIKKLSPRAREGESRILAVDSSIVRREMKFAALWAIHVVSLFGIFDNSMHEDPLVGGKKILYRDLQYNSNLDLGKFESHDRLEENSNVIRVAYEYKSLLDSWREMNSDADYLLLDGSIQTVLKRIKDNETLMGIYNELKSSGKLVGMVEDSASVGIARSLGTKLTDIALFDLVLEENEFIVQEVEGVNVCYVKLPSKNLSYTPSRKSEPLVVKWEFAYPDFVPDLENLAAIWSMEDDLLHPQLYPIRIADYLTRKVKAGGILDTFVRDNEMEPRHRDMREFRP